MFLPVEPGPISHVCQSRRQSRAIQVAALLARLLLSLNRRSAVRTIGIDFEKLLPFELPSDPFDTRVAFDKAGVGDKQFRDVLQLVSAAERFVQSAT